MARQHGEKITGTIGNKTGFKRGGEYFVKNRSNLDRERVMTDPAFENSRKSMTVFGACSLAASIIRVSLMPLPKLFGERNSWNRLVGTVQEVMLGNKGKNGKGCILFSRFGCFFEKFNFNKSNLFDGVFLAPLEIEFNETKGQVVTKTAAFDPLKFINAPISATHYRLLNAYCIMSDYKLNKKSNVFMEIVPEVNGMAKIKYSSYLALNNAEQKSITLKNAIKIDCLPANTAMLILVGIEFYKQEGGRFYDLKSRRGLKVLKVIQGVD